MKIRSNWANFIFQKKTSFCWLEKLVGTFIFQNRNYDKNHKKYNCYIREKVFIYNK